jgi:peptide subunit release factor 1 (eRF1)
MALVVLVVYFYEISQDTGKYVFSVKDTLACLEMGAVETLIVWEALDCNSWVLASFFLLFSVISFSFF